MISSNVAALIVVSLVISTTDGLVPKPTKWEKGETIYGLEEPLQFVHDYPACFILHDAQVRFASRLRLNQILMATNESVTRTIKQIKIHIKCGCNELPMKLWPSEKMTEDYSLNIDNELIDISATEIWGVLHALETTLQLVRKTPKRLLVINGTQIEDNPRYGHRGYLIDSARHYLSVEKIQQFMDAMAMVKMNVLHWHIVDDESFPYYSFTFPLLNAKGAFDSSVYVYTQNDIQRIIEYGRLRGLRVMPEFDTPGHTLSWGKGHPEVLTECYDKEKPNGKYGPMNPAVENTYNFMLMLLTEIQYTFPDSFIHLGGDEVDHGCWRSNPKIQAFMEKMHFGSNYSLLQTYYTEQLLKLVQLLKKRNTSRTSVVWQEVFDEGFKTDNETIIHVWKPEWKSEMKRVTEAGFKVLFSSCWYLSHISYAEDWLAHYRCDPADFNGTETEKSRIIGGEAAMWGEYVDDTNLFSRSWPRGASVAERLWTKGELDSKEFSPRLDRLTCQMIRRGWNAEPVNGPGFCPS
ncbi:unnamed protein product [Calicophoron daubneyi]|uniref:Beta-hexosaminidase n=1 Tax=Calicophoron daubneyi TaxID=300641 RepID=A0AAV2TQN5_CALDB